MARFVLHTRDMNGIEKRIVYILQSEFDRTRFYAGITNDLTGRVEWHNRALHGYTVDHRPWSLVVSLEFSTEKAAVRFEKYLKSGSGRAFAKRHLAPVID